MPPALIKFVIDTIIILTVFGTIFFIYQAYGNRVIEEFFGEQKISILLGDTPVVVSIADDAEEQRVGLSGVESLPENEGKIFIFDQEGKYGFWMKDTLIPLDIIWVNDALEIVHIEQNVKPESYPTIYHSPVPARFVVEVNAFFVSTFKVEKGEKISIPAHRLPPDLK